MRHDGLFPIQSRYDQAMTGAVIEDSPAGYDFQTKYRHLHYSCTEAVMAFAFSTTSSMVPTLKNAASGYWSISPEMIA